MGAIFISYRREDAEGHAGRLFEDLREVFGADSVFMDVVGIEPGVDFRKTIDAKVTSCSVLLALMGRQWLDLKGPDGRRRLDDAGDFVRLETAAALRRDIPVVPVLVQGAKMPTEVQLPDDLKDLAFRNGVELTHARWESDVQLLVAALAKHVQPLPKPALAPAQPAVRAAAPGPAPVQALASMPDPAATAASGAGRRTLVIAGGVAAALLVVGLVAQSGGEPAAESVSSVVAQEPTRSGPPPAAAYSHAGTQVVIGDASGKVLGRYVAVQDGAWVETGPDGKEARFEFTESGRSADQVQLYDSSRDVHIRLDLAGRRVMYAQGQGAETPLYRIVEVQ
jgi:hypothetical protein